MVGFSHRCRPAPPTWRWSRPDGFRWSAAGRSPPPCSWARLAPSPCSRSPWCNCTERWEETFTFVLTLKHSLLDNGNFDWKSTRFHQLNVRLRTIYKFTLLYTTASLFLFCWSLIHLHSGCTLLYFHTTISLRGRQRFLLNAWMNR